MNTLFNLIKKFLKKPDDENIEFIRKSKYFDENYYKLENPEVKGDLCRHYYYYGWKEGKSPSYDFSNDAYLKKYRDVTDAKINPLLHYLKFGKAENRTIEKDNGASLKKVYESIYDCPYFYKTYICDDKIKRVNLFFDKIDSNIYDMNLLFDFIIKKCSLEKLQLRIVYNIADFEVLKDFLEKNSLELPADTVFLNLKNSNYLEISLFEEYVCTSWKNARAILNTHSINNNIYFYVKTLDNLSDSEYYQISNICCNDKVVCLVNDDNILNNLKLCKLKFESNEQKITSKKTNQLYCNFGDMFIVGVELLNEAFLRGELDSKRWIVNVTSIKKELKFHFDTDVKVRNVEEIDEYADFIFALSYAKNKGTYDVPTIVGFVEKQEYIKKEVIYLDNITKKDLKFTYEKADDLKIDNSYQKFADELRIIRGKTNV